MRKEVETTEDAFFCDICGEQIHDAHWSYGGYASAAEETERCTICSRDTCLKCRKHVSFLWVNRSQCICGECLEANKDSFVKIEQNSKNYHKEVELLRQRHVSTEKLLIKSLVSGGRKNG